MLMHDRELEYGPPPQRRAQTADKPVDIFGGFFVFGFALSSGLRRLVCVVAARMTFAQAGLGCPGQDHGDLLDVLRCGCRQALACDAGLTSEAGTAMTVKLLGVGKRALDRLLAAFVDRPCPRTSGGWHRCARGHRPRHTGWSQRRLRCRRPTTGSRGRSPGRSDSGDSRCDRNRWPASFRISSRLHRNAH